MAGNNKYVINLRGEKEPFSKEKVYRSALRAGASKPVARKIAEIVGREVRPGTKTSEIFNKVKSFLRKETPGAAIRFNLKKGIGKLGPTGFPFEKYVGDLLRHQGFKVKINQMVPAKCVRSYEIDFVAQKGNEICVGECKYRNQPGDRVHSLDVLANYARFLDIFAGPRFNNKKGVKIKSVMVTNTKFTGKSADYARCVGIELLGWKYPAGFGLERIIEEKGLYPVTILPSLKGYVKDILVSEQMMLAADVLGVDSRKFTKKFNIQEKHFSPLVREAKLLLE